MALSPSAPISKTCSAHNCTASPDSSRKIAPIAPGVDSSKCRRMRSNAKLCSASDLFFDLDVAALDCLDERLDDARIEARACEALDLLHDVAELHRLLVGAIRRHGVEGVGDRHDARLHRDLLFLQVVG